MAEQKEPTPEEQEAARRLRSLSLAEDQAWEHLARAVDKDKPYDARRRDAGMAADLFTAVAAVGGSPVEVVNRVMPVSLDEDTLDAITERLRLTFNQDPPTKEN